MNNQPWWKKDVDEMLAIAGGIALGIVAIIFLKDKGIPVATASVTLLGTYLGKGKINNK